MHMLAEVAWVEVGWNLPHLFLALLETGSLPELGAHPFVYPADEEAGPGILLSPALGL